MDRKRKTRISFDKNGKYDQTVSKKINDIIDMASFDSDPLGSYTGLPEDKSELPTQDADDL